MAKPLNPNDLEYRNKIIQNLKLCFEEKDININLNNCIEITIKTLNEFNIKVDYNHLYEYIVKYCEFFFIKKINDEYLRIISLCDGSKLRYNNELILNHLNFDINSQNNIYRSFINNYLMHTPLFPEIYYYKLTPVHNMYLFNLLNNKIEENRKENEAIKIEIKKLKEFNYSVLKVKDTIIEENEKKYKSHEYHYLSLKESVISLINDNINHDASLKIFKHNIEDCKKFIEFLGEENNKLQKIIIVNFIISLMSLVIVILR